jgi:hypothetical protein
LVRRCLLLDAVDDRPAMSPKCHPVMHWCYGYLHGRRVPR